MIGVNTAHRSLAARSWPARLLLYLGLCVFAAAFLAPFYWMIISALRPQSEFYQIPIPVIPSHLTLQDFVLLFQRSEFGRGLLNSAFLAFVSVVLQVFFSSLAGYTFAKLTFRGKDVLFTAMLATMMIPYMVTIIPNYIIMAHLGWIDTYWPLIIPGIANAFGIFWMRQYCQSIPSELLDAARIDGAGEFMIYWRVVVPLIQPALASLAIFVFLSTWNDFLNPLVFLRNQDLFTVQLWLAVVSHEGNVGQPAIVMAGSVLASIPVLLIFIFMQKRFVAGLTAGSIK
ncbi:MAG TPA: carbohydrate ABC transporter permease [Chloroflexota bacterium]|nr:carbohydrate ABC transporter permease [Chloroflexota bacterium]